MNNYKNKINKAKRLAARRGGKCLSDVFVNSKSKLQWKCKIDAHPAWFTTLYKVEIGQWCRICSFKLSGEKRRKSLSYYNSIAIGKGGQCLSKTYLGSEVKLEWKCSNEDHPSWFTLPGVIYRGGWCKRCASTANANQTRDNIENMQSLANERGGKCLTKYYTNRKTKLNWKCGTCKESWWASPLSILSGTWCPNCSNGLGERLTRCTLEQLLGIKLKSSAPDWLVFNGEQLHLDGYNSDLKIAFEHQGLQHYDFHRYFHRGDFNLFLHQIERDEFNGQFHWWEPPSFTLGSHFGC